MCLVYLFNWNSFLYNIWSYRVKDNWPVQRYCKSKDTGAVASDIALLFLLLILTRHLVHAQSFPKTNVFYLLYFFLFILTLIKANVKSATYEITTSSLSRANRVVLNDLKHYLSWKLGGFYAAKWDLGFIIKLRRQCLVGHKVSQSLSTLYKFLKLLFLMFCLVIG